MLSSVSEAAEHPSTRNLSMHDCLEDPGCEQERPDPGSGIASIGVGKAPCLPFLGDEYFARGVPNIEEQVVLLAKALLPPCSPLLGDDCFVGSEDIEEQVVLLPKPLLPTF